MDNPKKMADEHEALNTIGPEEIIAVVDNLKPEDIDYERDEEKILAVLKKAMTVINNEEDATQAIQQAKQAELVIQFLLDLKTDGDARLKLGFGSGFLYLGIVKIEGHKTQVGFVNNSKNTDYDKKWTGPRFD